MYLRPLTALKGAIRRWSTMVGPPPMARTARQQPRVNGLTRLMPKISPSVRRIAGKVRNELRDLDAEEHWGAPSRAQAQATRRSAHCDARRLALDLKIDLYTEEGLIGRSYLEPYIRRSMRYLIPALHDSVRCSRAAASLRSNFSKRPASRCISSAMRAWR